jgi:hypothetical protein
MLCSIGVVAGGRIDDIKSQPQCLVNHLRNESCEKWAGKLQARISVDFYEPWVKLAVNHEIKTEYLEIMLITLRG